MAPSKRKATASDDESDDEWDHSDNFSVASSSQSRDDNLDIFNSLVGPSKRAKREPKVEPEVDGSNIEEDNDGSDGDAEFIRKHIEKRNVKGGMDVVKKAAKVKGMTAKSVSGGGSFQSMGLHPSLLRALLMNGYKTPTPIQRMTIPSSLATPPRDLVGMARTGSGKTLAFMVPLLQRLGGRHSTTFGARALILVPTRELALQILRVGKQMAKGWDKGGDHAGDMSDDGNITTPAKGQALRWGLIVGGESLDEQFNMMANNPDIIIATPGRLLHIVVEMNLELRSTQFVVFDEADRLFEMGFATALNEIIQRLPSTRQTLLFSATLPKNLVEFAKAGLQDPKLVRLDAETKISTDLRMAFFSVKHAEKDACLLTLLRDVIKVPLAADRSQKSHEKSDKRKGKRGEGPVQLASHQTLIFTATKHHVEYLSNLLVAAGYSVSHIYGSLDQTARRMQMDNFRKGASDILVVTDVAARGIDIPVLENVVNYDFPHGARVFVHRVGRTARAGRQGWAWSLVSHNELPHLLDLQLFLGRELKTTVEPEEGESAFVENLVLGTFPRDTIGEEMEHLEALDFSSKHLPTLREVMIRGHGLYERTMGKASQQSHKRAKEMSKDDKWGLAGSLGGGLTMHPAIVLKNPEFAGKGKGSSGSQFDGNGDLKRQEMLKAVSSFRPQETVFEIGAKGKKEGAMLMKGRRKALEKAVQRAGDKSQLPTSTDDMGTDDESGEDVEMTEYTTRPSTSSYRDPEFYLSYEQKDANTDKGYSLKDGASFIQNANAASFDLGNTDEHLTGRLRHNDPSQKLTWSKTKKKFIKGTGEGSDNVKFIRTENGTKLPITYRSGRFDEWKAKSHIRLPRTGEQELPGRGEALSTGRTYKHNKVTEPKPLDPKSIGYERKLRQLKKKEQAAKMLTDGDEGGELEMSNEGGRRKGKGKAGVRFGKPVGKVKSELKSAEVIRKERNVHAKKQSRYGRPSKKKKVKKGK